MITYDLWETIIGNDEFIGVFDSLKDAKLIGGFRHKKLDGISRSSVSIEWVEDGDNHYIEKRGDEEEWR